MDLLHVKRCLCGGVGVGQTGEGGSDLDGTELRGQEDELLDCSFADEGEEGQGNLDGDDSVDAHLLGEDIEVADHIIQVNIEYVEF